ncbi:MAG: oxidoreductase family protein [Paenibacillaceae bacterium]|jgi:predicted dehydrogenase|nr:oxidoreductase family protein [Paenibacillaceae bacterium]
MIHAALIGAGKRGTNAYGSYAFRRPNEIKFVAVAEPNENRRRRFANMHNIPEDRQFKSWEEMLAQPQICEALLICTMDRDHFAPTIKALEVGYHILLEKPMSPDPLESLLIAEKAEQTKRILTVCHVMRYSNAMKELKRIIDTKLIGDLMTIQWLENVGYEHYVSSFVRGNWRNSTESSFMLLQKSCHDIDMLYWLVGADCVEVSSYGKLSHFRLDKAPEGSTDRCVDGCAVETVCPYSAIKNYYHTKSGGWYNAVSQDNSLEARMKAIKEGPFGRCVYRCDNDVVDHQVVNMLFANDVTVSFNMTGFTAKNQRTFKIMGTLGEIVYNGDDKGIQVNLFSGRQERIYPEQVAGGHGGSDFLIMQDFVRQVAKGDLVGKTSAGESARSHMITFAAEHSRVTGQSVKLADYMEQVKLGTISNTTVKR